MTLRTLVLVVFLIAWLATGIVSGIVMGRRHDRCLTGSYGRCSAPRRVRCSCRSPCRCGPPGSLAWGQPVGRLGGGQAGGRVAGQRPTSPLSIRGAVACSWVPTGRPRAGRQGRGSAWSTELSLRSPRLFRPGRRPRARAPSPWRRGWSPRCQAGHWTSPHLWPRPPVSHSHPRRQWC